MTVLCAMNEPGVGTWFASDSLISDGDGLRMTNKQRKWIRGEGFAWGVCGCWAAYTALSDQVLGTVNLHWTPAKLYRHMRDILSDFGFTADESRGKPLWFDVSSLFVTVYGATRIDGDGTTITHGPHEFVARGSGGPIAEGAAWSMIRRGEPAQTIVIEAVKAAMAIDGRCGGELYLGLIGEAQDQELIDATPTYAALLAGVEKTTDELIASIRKK